MELNQDIEKLFSVFVKAEVDVKGSGFRVKWCFAALSLRITYQLKCSPHARVFCSEESACFSKNVPDICQCQVQTTTTTTFEHLIHIVPSSELLE